MQTRESLIAFEKRVADAFLDKRIHAPVHLSGGNEEQLLKIFEDIRPNDWVFSNWRSHYHALLKGIPEEEVFQKILDGRSMYLMSKEHRFMASSIVGGMLPISCGVSMGIKRRGGSEKCFVFVGDMTARTGLFHEFCQYCVGHDLLIQVVIEDNGLSTDTPTDEVWGYERWRLERWDKILRSDYFYQRIYPHVGVGQHVSF